MGKVRHCEMSPSSGQSAKTTPCVIASSPPPSCLLVRIDAADGVAARVALAAELARSDVSARPGVSTYLGGLVADAALPFPERVSAVRTLGQLGPAARAAALALLPQFAVGAVADLRPRWEFAQELSFWSRQFQAAAADFLHDLAAALSGPDAAHTAWQLTTLNEPEPERAADALRQIGRRPAEPAGVLALAAKKLALLGPRYRPEGIDRLRDLSRARRREHFAVTMLWELAFLDDVDHAVAQLAVIAADPAVAVPTRTKAARTMLMLKPDCPPEPVQALRLMSEDPSLPEVELSWVREAMNYFGLVPA